ncbi:hypothetical protein CONCODRAFT_71057 [Conidiobolus coronatus NRRL 28638]|uniref:Uncharacterized protein n=1 Tax=Conidiobolus coronatus (strain ATCC 28846 / CBS 209.66 / NRRL 28638) TaxID=796925 RepID=A0A137P4M2_CONC2|nr:hypothetical protein CONCODRAFT_71057 [Conidiobolus coronatus NRRL 28638]|eukprot:KXN69943.1 hypothetical protein CONCODRAFT_71057 [Conidiobolus coronatus NRRL 28638]
MRVKKLVTLILFHNISGNSSRVVLPSQSTDFLNEFLYIYSPTIGGNKTKNLFKCSYQNQSRNFLCNGSSELDGTPSGLLDYKFLKSSSLMESKISTFAFGAVNYNFIDTNHPKIRVRFCSVTSEAGSTTKSEFENMKEPNFPNFPDIEYGVSLVGDPSLSNNSSNAQLYILGGSKYFKLGKSVQMIKNFSAYEFNTNKWHDYTDKLPDSFDNAAGHQLININNQKLIVLGGYRTKSYTFDDQLTANNPEFIDFKKILVFDISKQKWEYKITNIGDQDQKVLELRMQYSCTAVYQNNKLYVYAGFYVDDSKHKTIHLFGVLDLNQWAWRWKQIQVENRTSEDPQTAFFDSILKDNIMIVTNSNALSFDEVKFISFNITSEDLNNSGYIGINSDYLNENQSIKFGTLRKIIIFDWVILTICTLVIIFLLWKYYLNCREARGYLPRFVDYHIWTDLDFNDCKNSFLIRGFSSNSGSGFDSRYLSTLSNFDESAISKECWVNRDSYCECKTLVRNSELSSNNNSTLVSQDDISDYKDYWDTGNK